MKSVLLILAAALALWGWSSPAGRAAEPAAVIKLWPHGAPGEKGDLGEEHDTTKPTDNLIAGRRLIRLGNVSKPTISVYRPPKDQDTGAAVLVCPGGGYHILAWDLEGTEVCEWLNSIGVTGVLLKYRVPKRPDAPRHLAPMQDAQRALSLIRHQAPELGLDPARLGMLGFSAGAHLSAVVSSATNRAYAPVDEADQAAARPDFTLLIYPAYLTAKELGDKVSPEIHLGSHTPPAFIVITQDDPVRMENALLFAVAAKQFNVPVELHLYPTGGHGYGLRRTDNPVTWWSDRAADWLRAGGWLKRSARGRAALQPGRLRSPSFRRHRSG
ncbi:MAG TPA: alpha/beta hydrolase [Methylomirabilota bacterium]|nr:alpha/beta hydrolase [Methylomirabilota bacterium]